MLLCQFVLMTSEIALLLPIPLGIHIHISNFLAITTYGKITTLFKAGGTMCGHNQTQLNLCKLKSLPIFARISIVIWSIFPKCVTNIVINIIT